MQTLEPTSGEHEALSRAALAVSSADGEGIHRELTRYLATALDVECAFIAMCTGEENSHVRTLAVYADAAFEDNFEYLLAGTVCGTVVGREFRFVPSGVALLYPEDPMFKRLAIEGYAAYPMHASDGGALGLIAVLSRRTLADRELAESMLRIFAARAASEVERQQVDAARRTSEESYRAIFEATEDAIFVHDWDTGAIVDANPKACVHYGYAYEEMKGLRVAAISSGVHPYTEQEALRLIEEAKRSGPLRFEWRRKNRDGSLHWDEVCLKTAVIAGRRRVLAFTREITQRKEVEEALRSAALAVSSVEGDSVFRDLTRQLAATLGVDIAFIARFVDGKPGRMRTLGCWMDGDNVRNYEYSLKGTPCEAVVGRQFLFFPSGVRELFHEGNLHPLGVESYAAFPLFDTQGRALGLIAVADRKAMKDQGLVESVLKIFAARAASEIERQDAEAQLRQAQKMEAIGHLTGGIAHDFNNILTSIMGYLVLASERNADTGDPKLGKYIEQAHLASTRARDLIQQMLTFSRGQRGEPRPLALPSLIKESLKLMRSTLPSSIEMETELRTQVPAVLLDPVQMGQVLLNLCINARDAINGAGSIRVSVRLIEQANHTCSSCRKPIRAQTLVELAVRDTGTGIAPEMIDRIFDPFFSTKEVGKGSGMGLATVHGIVHEYGGHIVVDTSPGQGTEFRVLLPPLAQQCSDERTARGRSASRGRAAKFSGRVLLIDDEEMVGELMENLLTEWGMDVTVVNSAVEARDMFAADPGRFDLVVTDQTMPKLTGLEIATAMRRLRPDLPVILYTGYGENISGEQLADAGVLALVKKPIDPPVLQAALRQALPETRSELRSA